MSHVIHNLNNNTSFTAEDGETILGAALRNGHLYPYGCQSGSCGSCKAQIVKGQVSHLARNPEVLSDQELAQGMSLLCQAVPREDVEIDVREIAHTPKLEIRTMPTRVREHNLLCDDVVQLFLTLPNTQKFDFLPGQYIHILLKNGKERAFSIANTPTSAAEQGLELHIRVVPGGLYSSQVKDHVKVKDIVRIQGPFGTYFLRKEDDRPIIMVAGGTGFAPIKALVEDAIENNLSQPITLYWGARAREDLYLDQLARQWADTLDHFSYIPVLSEPAPGDQWTGRTGFVHAAVTEDFSDLSAHSVYASGPPVMINALTDNLHSNGLDERYFYSDAFDYAAEKE